MNPVQFYKGLADETRLKALLLIQLEGELCVCELMTALNESQPKISRHLALLREAEILNDRRQGQWVFYRLHPQLPPWALSTIKDTAMYNPALTTEAQQRLELMGERPERVRNCCGF